VAQQYRHILAAKVPEIDRRVSRLDGLVDDLVKAILGHAEVRQRLSNANIPPWLKHRVRCPIGRGFAKQRGDLE
jgi:hypothetical protein